jgi:hypothetical protein
MRTSMKMVPKAPNHHICLPSISIFQFYQDNPKGLRIVSQGNPNSTVLWLCLAHEATSTYDQIQSREVLSFIILCIYEPIWGPSIIHSSRLEVWPWKVDQSSHLTKLKITEIQLLMCLSNEDDPKRKTFLKNDMNKFHVHKKSILDL